MALSALVLPAAGCGQPLGATLEVSPTARTMVVGERLTVTVTRRFPGGALDEVTPRVMYASSDRNVLSVTDTPGTIEARRAGSALLRVYDPASDANTAATITVVQQRVDSLEIAPSPATILPRGTSRQFTALARFSDGTSRDVTGAVVWSSSNEAIVTVGNGPGDKGLVSAIGPGDTDVVVTDSATRVQGRTIVFVPGDAPQLRAIVVTPNPGSVNLGGKLQFAALGVLSDGTTQDLTRDVAWSSSQPNVLTIDAAGLSTGLGIGDATVTAASADPSSSVKGSASARVVP